MFEGWSRIIAAGLSLLGVLISAYVTLLGTGVIDRPGAGGDGPDPQPTFVRQDTETPERNVDVSGVWYYEGGYLEVWEDYTDEDGDDWYSFNDYNDDDFQVGEGWMVVGLDYVALIGTDFSEGEYLIEFEGATEDRLVGPVTNPFGDTYCCIVFARSPEDL